MNWTSEQLAKYEARTKHTRLRSQHAQPAQGDTLVSSSAGEDARWYGSAKRFEITYRVFSVRPPDWDGLDIKAVQDFLVAASILPDDKWSVLIGRVVSDKVSTPGEERTEIEIITL